MLAAFGFIFVRGRGSNVLFVRALFESLDDIDTMNFCVYLRETGLVLIRGTGLHPLSESVYRPWFARTARFAGPSLSSFPLKISFI